MLFGAAFLVNYVTSDKKGTWAEGLLMVLFYFMIVSFFSSFPHYSPAVTPYTPLNVFPSLLFIGRLHVVLLGSKSDRVDA